MMSKRVIKSKKTILANGLIDKKDVGDPTEKFSSPRHTGFKQSSYTRKNVTYNPSEYDLAMIANAVSLDGILRRSVNIYVEQILKNRFELNSKNQKLLIHIKRRIKEIEYFTGISFFETITQLSEQLVSYGNAYLVKERQNKLSKFGKSFNLYGRQLNPIVGLFLAEASTVEVGINNQAQVTTFKQEIRGSSIEWDERDIIHFTYNKIPGTLTGQSQIIPVLDDVRALRKLEEEIEILGFQYSIPLYVYKVGTKEIPPVAGEIDSVSSVINNMPSYGMVVIPGHHDITIPSNASNVMDIIKYVNHFKSRIYGGLGISPVAMSEIDSSNRATSEAADMAMQNIVKAYQQIIKNKIELDLFRELMLDGGFENIDEEIEFNFPEIDIEAQIKKETHIIAKWQNNLISRSEARNEMNYENEIDETETFLEKVDIPKLQLQIEGQLAIAKQKSTEKAKAASTSNKSAPANQHGKKTRPKYVKNSNENIFSSLTINNVKTFIQDLQSNIRDELTGELNNIIKYYNKFYHKNIISINQSIIDNYFEGLNLIIESKVNRAKNNLDNIEKLSWYSKEIKDYINYEYKKMNNLAKILMYDVLNTETILITSSNCKNHSDKILKLSELDFSKIPPFGYGCLCEIDGSKLNEENS